ncbi:FG-GAP repeat domain-containing protein [Alteromonas lipolytica]|uniref:Uncharacterized protein n=1 Tax=Alteromonas lipolytica TaxID=1856405 RepID=A0A1E8FIL2_9ALTE|nr:VCBS repeat-containing protein [Alteromonas lipolytica]OFI35303.1 hypothetical protein BFC17_17380 [Alteromonas lipolytica]GGF58427.1 hypothetical protein GCM10011338_08380 [Alteromonas lipolytica]
MTNHGKSLLIACLPLIILGCGGSGSSGNTGGSGSVGGSTGGSGSGGGTTTPTPIQIITNAQDYSPAEINEAGRTLADENYSGNQNPMVLTPQAIQQFVVDMFGEQGDTYLTLPSVGDEDYTSRVNGNGSVFHEFSCSYQGNVQYTGQVDENYLGNLWLNYRSCENEHGLVLSGSVALTVTALTEQEISYTINYGGLSWQIDGQEIELYGTENYTEKLTTAGYQVTGTQYVSFDLGSYSVLLDTDVDFSINNYGEFSAIALSGDVFMGNQGQVSLVYTADDDLPPDAYTGKLILTADTRVELEIIDNYLRITQDTDNDGEPDQGSYAWSWYNYMYETATPAEFVNLDILSKPPRADSVIPGFSDVYATTPVEVSPGYYEDEDTPESQLEISYNWYVNGELIPEEHGSILPSGMVVHNDILGVSMVVFDGGMRTESVISEFIVSDSPAEVTVVNLPETIAAGSTVQFTAQITDPDIASSATTASLVAGPTGATMDADGLVTWHVPGNFLFPEQQYDFTFGWPDAANSETQRISIQATAANTNTFVRGNIAIPRGLDSLRIGDFDGDGENELLSTDSHRAISLTKVTDTDFESKWFYSGELGIGGDIISLMASDFNGDDQTDILVATEHGVSVITDLAHKAEVLISDNVHFISAAKLADTNHDGTPELIYVITEDDYLTSPKRLNIVSLDAPDSILFSIDFNGNNEDFAIANVDDDPAMELITNARLVYDLDTGENQWLFGNGGLYNQVEAGDLNGDGVAEIIVANMYGDIAVFDARSRSQLATAANANICDLITYDLDNDNVVELIANGCLLSDMTAYSLSSNQLITEWELEVDSRRFTSMIAGDADNDGESELIWITDSIEPVLASADIVDGVAIANATRNSTQLLLFSAAGWANYLPGDERAVFYVRQSTTIEGTSGSRVVSIDDNGKVEIGDEVSFSYHYSTIAATADYNNDGAGEIFIPSSGNTEGLVAAVQLYDNTVQWSYGGNSDDLDIDIGVIRASDMNNDGYQDFVYNDGSQLLAADIQNQLLLGSHSFTDRIHDFVSWHDASQNYTVVAQGTRTLLLSHSNSIFTELSGINQRCSRLELFNYDTDAAPEVLCVEENPDTYTSDTETFVVVFEINNNTLTEVQRTEMPTIFDIAVDPSTQTEQSFLAAVRESGSIYDNDTVVKIVNYNNKGHKIWQSSNIPGRPMPHGMKSRLGPNGLELLLSFETAMYWLR